MTQTALRIPDLIRQSLSDPRGVARRIMSLQLPLPVLWEALALVVVLSGVTAHGSNLVADALSGDGEMVLPALFYSPLLLTGIQGALLVLMVLALHFIGRGFGGRGELSESVALVAWLQFLMVCLQVVQGAAMLFLPGLSALIGIAGVIAFFYLLTQFTCEMHGFSNPVMVLVGIVLSMIAIIVALSILLGLFGIGVPGEMPDV